MNIYHAIQMITEEPSRNKKEELLAINDTELFRKVLKYTYDGSKQYYIKKVPEPTQGLATILDLNGFLTLLDDLAARRFTGNAAIKLVSDNLGMMSEDDRKVAGMILERTLRAGFSESTINKVFGKGFIPEYKVMLASSHNEKSVANIKYPAIAQLKADGMRVNAIVTEGVVTFISRNGKPVDCGTPEMEAELIKMEDLYGEPIVIDGELICIKDGKHLDRKKSNGYAQKATKGTVTDEIKQLFHILAWDIIPLYAQDVGKFDRPYYKRYADLASLCQENKLILPIESKSVNSIQEANALSADYISQGLEGIILKNADGIWENKRSKNQVKFKAVYDGDFRVVGWEYGKKGSQNEHRMGALVVESECGQIRCSVGTGFSDKDRDETTEENSLDRIVELQYNEIIREKKRKDTLSLFLPVFVEFRDDKTIANSLDELEGLKK